MAIDPRDSKPGTTNEMGGVSDTGLQVGNHYGNTTVNNTYNIAAATALQATVRRSRPLFMATAAFSVVVVSSVAFLVGDSSPSSPSSAASTHKTTNTPPLTPAPTSTSPDVPIAILRADTNAVDTVAFSPDGKLLASGGDDGVLRLWTIATRAAVTLPGHSAPVQAVDFSPDGRTLASGDGEENSTTNTHSLKLGDVVSDKQIADLTPQSAGVSRSSSVPTVRHSQSATPTVRRRCGI